MKNVGEPSLAIARLALILKVAANIYIQPFALLQDVLSHELANELEKTRQKAIDADECFDTDEIVEDALQTFSQNYKLTYGYITIPTIAF